MKVSLPLADVLGSTNLVGRPLGEEHLSVLLNAIFATPSESAINLDCTRVSLITASWVAAAIVPILQQRAAGTLNRYLLFGNLPADLQAEVAYVLRHEQTPALHSGPPPTVLGSLDEPYSAALDQVHKLGATTAKDLQAASAESIGHTAWINRLTTLANLGLVRRSKVGREYLYTSLVETCNG